MSSSSKLFHTIVAVGIALGSASAVGCASPSDGDSQAATDNALYGTNDPAPANNADAGTNNPDAGAFCDVPWPTTKGGLHHRPPPACIDPTHACANVAGGPVECAPIDAHGVCGWDTKISVCVNGAWVCNPGEQEVTICKCNAGEPCDPSANPPTTTTTTPTTN